MPFGIDDGLLIGTTLAKSLMGKSNADTLQEQGAALANRGSRYQLADQAARLPLRGMAIDRLLAPQPDRENLDSIFSDPGNPYARPVDRPIAALPPLQDSSIPNRPGTSFGGGGSEMGGDLPPANTTGQNYTDAVRSIGNALPTGLPGDFRTHDLEQRAAGRPGPSNFFGVGNTQEEARRQLAQQHVRAAALPSGGYYG